MHERPLHAMARRSGVHVRTMLAALVLALVSGCTTDKPKRAAPTIVRVSDAAVTTDVDGHTLALARAARDAARRVALECRLQRSFDDNVIRYYDICSWGRDVLEPLRAAAAALRAVGPDAGEAAVFIEHVRLFSEWVELMREGRAQGTLAHYQDLARAWNSFQPSEPIPVDERARSRYGGDDGPDAGPDGGPIHWERCSDGACVVIFTSK